MYIFLQLLKNVRNCSLFLYTQGLTLVDALWQKVSVQRFAKSEFDHELQLPLYCCFSYGRSLGNCYVWPFTYHEHVSIIEQVWQIVMNSVNRLNGPLQCAILDMSQIHNTQTVTCWSLWRLPSFNNSYIKLYNLGYYNRKVINFHIWFSWHCHQGVPFTVRVYFLFYKHPSVLGTDSFSTQMELLHI